MNTPEEHAAAVLRAPGQITVASIAGAIRAYAEEIKGSQIDEADNLAAVTAERDAERTARRALAEALKWVVTIEDNPLRGTTVRLPFSCEHAVKNALALAAKLP
jgi:hypothetical protein